MRGYRNLDLWATEREAAEVLPCGLKVSKSQVAERNLFLLKMWNPKATKPFANYSFKTEEARQKYIDNVVTNQESHLASKAKRNAERKGTAENHASVNVGDIFSHSWGYDQTNVDFYEVIEKSGSHVTVREIMTASTGLTGNGMADHAVPLKGEFVKNSKPMKKLLQFSGNSPYITMRHGWCSKWDGKPEYRSWYA